MDTCREVVADDEVAVIAYGELASGEVERARGVIGRVLRRYRLGAHARIRLTRHGRIDGSTVAQVNLRNGRIPIRTQIDGPGGFALTFAAERLDRQLSRLTMESEPRRAPEPGRAPLAFVTEERPIVRRKECVPLVCDPGTAIAAMDALDYDAHLFTDATTGEDAIVYWAGPQGVRMARQRRIQPPPNLAKLGLTMNPHPTRSLSESDAASRLCVYGLPFLFYTDAGDRRGRLLYRRYDGDLGLVIASSNQE